MNIDMTSVTNISLEWLVFLIAAVVMVLSKDIVRFFKPFLSNLILVIPAGTVLVSTIMLFRLVVPVWLVPPHICCLLVFSAAILVTLWGVINGSFKPETAYKQDAP
jgi:hypothetical protein